MTVVSICHVAATLVNTTATLVQIPNASILTTVVLLTLSLQNAVSRLVLLQTLLVLVRAAQAVLVAQVDQADLQAQVVQRLAQVARRLVQAELQILDLVREQRADRVLQKKSVASVYSICVALMENAKTLISALECAQTI